MDVHAGVSLPDLISLMGRTAVVTGGARGFGAGIARRLAEAGARVVVADSNTDGAEATATRLASEGWQAVGAEVDVSDEESVEALFEGAGLDASILVNNAGVFSNYLAEAMPLQEWNRIMAVNVAGTFLCSRTAIRRWKPTGTSGAIINVASVDATHPSAEGLLHYTTSKHAIAGLTRSLAMETAPFGIRVNAICPGAAITEGAIELVTQGAPEGIDVAAQWDGIKDRTPMGRLCTPDDIGRAAVFLASDLSAFVTGILLPVDGGILIQPLEGYVPTTRGEE